MAASREELSSESFSIPQGFWWFLAVFGAATLLKILHLVQYVDKIIYAKSPLADAAYYDAWAQRVASGQGYGPSPFYLAPLYPYWLALVYMVAGHNLMLIYALQAMIGLVSLLLVYWLGRKLFCSAAALIAVILVFRYAPILIVETKLLSEPLGIFLTLAALALLLSNVEKPTAPKAILTGVALGLSILCRSSNLFFAGLLAVWLVYRWWRKRELGSLPNAALVFAGVAISILPVTARNYIVGKDFALIQTNLGMTFAQGNNEVAAGVLSDPPGMSCGITTQQSEEMALAARELGRPVKPSESSSFWTKRTLRWMAQNPEAAAKLLGKKFVYSFNDREELDSYETYYEIAKLPTLNLFTAPFSLLVCFALVALVQKWRSPAVQILSLYLASTLFTLIVFYMSSRYRLVAAPVLGILAGQGMVSAWRCVRERKMAAIAAIAVALVATTAVARFPYPMKKSTGAFVLTQLANQRLAAGDLGGAINVYKYACQEFPEATELNADLGAALALGGDYSEAIEQYRIALKDWSQEPQLHVKLANALERVGDQDQADIHWLEALRLAPNSAKVLVLRGVSLMNRGRLPEAQECFERALKNDPNSVLGNNNLGSVLAQSGKRTEAVEYFRKAVQLEPTYVRARCNLSRALAETGQLDQAITNLQDGVKLQPDVPPLHFDLAQLLAHAGKTPEAIAEYQQVIRLDPSNDLARQQLDALK